LNTLFKKRDLYCILFPGILAIFFGLFCRSSVQKKDLKIWSVRMTESIMKRNPESWMIDFRKKPKWEYTQGLVLKAIMEVWKTTGNDRYFQYVRKYYDQFIDLDGNIMLYKLEEYNIDRINPGKVLFDLYAETGDNKYKKAIFLLRKQMKIHPRTSEGGFWHKKIYPHQMWLDGIYMASPFLAEFGKVFNEPELFDDVVNQIILMNKYARDDKTGLLYHGWDEKKEQLWSDLQTGQSPHFWGRGMGWYSMALVDVLDFIPEEHAKRPDIINIINRFFHAVAKVQDKQTGLWYQVLNLKEREGNYIESSASCMFVYSMLKAVRKGYIESKFLKLAQKGYKGILKYFIEIDKDDLIHIHQACAVAGLGGDPYRDGSYEYYINTKIRSNDPKATGPFILASLEMESL
jgi:unsaturated rhamnogalacturonyl hydrolase